MRWTLVLGFALLATAGCEKKKPPEAPPPPNQKVCASNLDCPTGWVCLSGACADTRKSAAFTHPDEMVTPDKVRKEVELRQGQHMGQVDQALKSPPASKNE